jgi:glucans biosynthesis protein
MNSRDLNRQRMAAREMHVLKKTRRMRASRLLSLIGVSVACMVGVAATRPEATPAPRTQAQPKAFSANTVIEIARRLSASAYAPHRIDNSPLQQLNYDQYRHIRFNRNDTIWRNEQVPFHVEVLPAGFLFQTPVQVWIVENGQPREIQSAPGMFVLDDKVQKLLANVPIPISGLRLQTRLNSRSTWDEFAAFQGASYFRAVPKDGFYGLSARGLAIRTAHALGEEFPTFTQFWVERPNANAASIVVHALLDSQSTTGAYKFSITPGVDTVMDVDMTLFPRVQLENVGIAPLTSMFLFDESERARIDDFRDEVHDSDGLQILLASGERVFRPLRNPTQLQISSFTSNAPQGFGLVQRSRKLIDYYDFEAHYQDRPSAWIEPTSKWGAGEVQLVEIPTDRESNDNIVAFFHLKDALPVGKPWHASYRIHWTPSPKLGPKMGRVLVTRSGPTFDGKRRIFAVDFAGVGRTTDDLTIDAGTSAGRLVNLVLQPNPVTKGIRASFELDANGAPVAELRLRLLRDGKPITETWLYRWTAS